MPAFRILAAGSMYPPHHVGGYEAMCQAAMRRARQLGHQVRVLTSDYRGSAESREDDPNVYRTLRWYWDLERYEFPKLSLLDRLRIERHNASELTRHLKEFRPHVVAWWSMGGMSLSLIERVRRANIPAVLLVHDDWLVYGREFDQWMRMWRGRRMLVAPIVERLFGLPTGLDVSGAGALVFNSRYIQERAARTGVDTRGATVIYPGIETQLLRELPEKDWTWRLLYIGRIDRQKGIDTGVCALAHLPSQATLEVWGTGDESYIAEMRRYAEQLGLSGRLHFHGWAGSEDRMSAYGSADVVIFPARWQEPFGLVPLEAMGLGRPVVSTAGGGSAEYLRDGENALVVTRDDSLALAAAVRRLASDPELRTRLREGGRRTADLYTIERFADETVAEIIRAAAPP